MIPMQGFLQLSTPSLAASCLVRCRAQNALTVPLSMTSSLISHCQFHQGGLQPRVFHHHQQRGPSSLYEIGTKVADMGRFLLEYLLL
uniref:Uncharacterized protein n=1 Tax=Arundo donax TaxID=35708 RepID=A0A0A9CSM0_ARUDO